MCGQVPADPQSGGSRNWRPGRRRREGPGFDPSAVPDCRLDERLDAPGGRGVMLMRNFMTRIEYNTRGNRVLMEKQRPPAEAAAS